jgi:ssDNA-binding Zn-finger/Zn-ribbon topoisomerase 1
MVRDTGKLPDGKVTEKVCPECGGRLVVRTNKATGSQFLGCANYPECRRAEPIPEALRMRLAGQPTLFE